MSTTNSRLARGGGAALASLGVAHLVRPELFEAIVGKAYPLNTRWHVHVNGVAETILGFGILWRRTRPFASAAFAVHVVNLQRRAARVRRRPLRLEMDWSELDSEAPEEDLLIVYSD